MADIKRYPFVRDFRGTPTAHVVHLSGGRACHDEAGMSFWFRPLSAVSSEVPVDDRELPLLFHARTRDRAGGQPRDRPPRGHGTR